MSQKSAKEELLNTHLDAFSSELHCYLCNKLYKSPYTATHCGHIYCYECIQKHLKAGNSECPQCGVQIQGKSLTRNSSYATMVQCVSKIKNLLNGTTEQSQSLLAQQEKQDKVKEETDLLMTILDGIIDEDEGKENIVESRNNLPIVKKSSNVIPKINKNKKVIEAKLPKKKRISSESETVPSGKIATKQKRFGLLLTGLSEDQKATVHSNLQNLSKISGNLPFRVIKDYSPDLVSHIICACAPKSHCPRTLKYLLGIAGKSWIISFDWILESLEAGSLLNEDKFVVVGDEAVRMNTFACEKSRADPGHLFDNLKFYLSGSFTVIGPSKSDLINLIQVAGGTISKKAEPDAFIISDSHELRKGEYPYTWLFDAISCYEVKIS